jgi:hypothetical protein
LEIEIDILPLALMRGIDLMVDAQKIMLFQSTFPPNPSFAVRLSMCVGMKIVDPTLVAFHVELRSSLASLPVQKD